jgi:hypothetical protein
MLQAYHAECGNDFRQGWFCKMPQKTHKDKFESVLESITWLYLVEGVRLLTLKAPSYEDGVRLLTLKAPSYYPHSYSLASRSNAPLKNYVSARTIGNDTAIKNAQVNALARMRGIRLGHYNSFPTSIFAYRAFID